MQRTDPRRHRGLLEKQFTLARHASGPAPCQTLSTCLAFPGIQGSHSARTGESGMQKVQGFGGFFFRAQDPEGLASWYQAHLGIDPAPTNMDMTPWQTEAGVTVFSPFAADTDYFPTDKTFMLNFRVTDLDAMIAQLASAGIEISDESEMEGIGRFARIHDPEGNAIELWEPVS